MSFSAFCLPRLVVWSCSLTSIRAWLILSPFSPGSPFYKGSVCPWPWPRCMVKRACDMDSCVLWGKTGDIYLRSYSGRAKCHPFMSPWLLIKGSWRTGAGTGWKEKCRKEDDGRKLLANELERDQAMASQGKGFLMQRAGTGLRSPVSMRNCRAPLSCPLSPREEPLAKGYKIVQWALRTEDCVYGEICLMKTTRWRKTKCSQCFEVRSRRKGRSSPLWPSDMSLIQSGSSFEQFSVHSLETFLSNWCNICALHPFLWLYHLLYIPSLSYE